MKKEKEFLLFFRKQLMVYRNIKGLSQHRLAKMLGISRFSIVNYEQGHRVPDICTGLKIIRILEIDLVKMMEKIC